MEAHLRICEKITKILQFFHPRDQKFRAAKIAAQSAAIATSRFFDTRESESNGASSERYKLMEEQANSMRTNPEGGIPKIDGDTNITTKTKNSNGSKLIFSEFGENNTMRAQKMDNRRQQRVILTGITHANSEISNTGHGTRILQNNSASAKLM